MACGETFLTKCFNGFIRANIANILLRSEGTNHHAKSKFKIVLEYASIYTFQVNQQSLVPEGHIKMSKNYKCFWTYLDILKDYSIENCKKNE